jgi:D-lactate dehydrogenase
LKTLFYSTKDFEIPYLEAANKLSQTILFTKDSLSVHTVEMAKGFEIISIFTNDDASAEVLKILHNNGTKFIAVRATGYDNVDIENAHNLGIVVANVPNYSPCAIAEHSVALLLALNRKIALSNKQVHHHNFSINNLIGFDLYNKTVGIIGVGRIGSVFAKIMHGFGCTLLGHDIEKNKILIEKYNLKYVDLKTLCAQSNIISIHTAYDKYKIYH